MVRFTSQAGLAETGIAPIDDAAAELLASLRGVGDDSDDDDIPRSWAPGMRMRMREAAAASSGTSFHASPLRAEGRSRARANARHQELASANSMPELSRDAAPRGRGALQRAGQQMLMRDRSWHEEPHGECPSATSTVTSTMRETMSTMRSSLVDTQNSWLPRHWRHANDRQPQSFSDEVMLRNGQQLHAQGVEVHHAVEEWYRSTHTSTQQSEASIANSTGTTSVCKQLKDPQQAGEPHKLCRPNAKAVDEVRSIAQHGEDSQSEVARLQCELEQAVAEKEVFKNRLLQELGQKDQWPDAEHEELRSELSKTQRERDHYKSELEGVKPLAEQLNLALTKCRSELQQAMRERDSCKTQLLQVSDEKEQCKLDLEKFRLRSVAAQAAEEELPKVLEHCNRQEQLFQQLQQDFNRVHEELLQKAQVSDDNAWKDITGGPFMSSAYSTLGCISSANSTLRATLRETAKSKSEWAMDNASATWGAGGVTWTDFSTPTRRRKFGVSNRMSRSQVSFCSYDGT